MAKVWQHIQLVNTRPRFRRSGNQAVNHQVWQNKKRWMPQMASTDDFLKPT